jgi:guanylate kinase
MAKLIILSGICGAGKTTMTAEAVKKIPGLLPLKSYTDRSPRSQHEADHSPEHYFISQDEYLKRQLSDKWINLHIYGYYYGIDLVELQYDARGYILIWSPINESIENIKQKSPIPAVSVLIDAEPNKAAKNIFKDRVQAEHFRIEEDKKLNTPIVKQNADHIFSPQWNLDQDTAEFVKLINEILK